jgi:threonine aldolase
MGGGTVWPLGDVEAVAAAGRSAGLATHMDGARLFNAEVASGIEAARYAAPFDTVWIDLSKGLGCPIGAVLAGSRDFVAEAWRWKQRMGGAMRQAGIVAAAGVYALTHHIERLGDDHANAARFAAIAAELPGIAVDLDAVHTNMVFLDVAGTGRRAGDIVAVLEQRGVLTGATGPSEIRVVTHLDVDREQVEEAGRILGDVVAAD